MNSDPIVMRIPVKQVKIRVAGAFVDALEFGSLWSADYSDGDTQLVSSPLNAWSFQNSAESAGDTVPIYFVIEAGGPAGNPGQNDDRQSITSFDKL